MKKRIGIVVLLIVAMMSFASCGSSTNDKGSVVIAGSTSVQPLSEALGSAYMENNKDVTVEVQGGGSGQGIKSIESEIANIGALSREVKDEEKGKIAKEYKIAMDGIAVIVNKEVGIKDLTLKQVKDIYTGKITNWKEVGGKAGKIAVVSREEGSGTRGAFVEITGVLTKDAKGTEKDLTTKDAIVQPSTGAAKQTVAKTPNAIAYVSLEALDETVDTVKIQGVEPTAKTVIDGTYKITRPFVYVVGEKVDKKTQAFIDFVMGEEGQKLVKENGFIPVK
ncbi:MAG: phosphate ABC transporter substrate-binding protein [Anaerovoracaceae bacterium]